MGFKIKANKREIFGKNASRRLRREGMIPAVIYGAREAYQRMKAMERPLINRDRIYRM